MEVGYFIWQLRAMPSNPLDLVAICKKYGIKRLAIKVLEKNFKYNTPNGDKPLMEYIKVLEDNGIIVEGWGYHYPDQTGLQGDAIEERRAKLGFKTYHIDVEGEWKKPTGMPKEAEALMNKLKVNGFEVLLCSYRYPSKHSQVPFDKFMNHAAMDGASPQVYWALSHNPVEQLEACLLEYSAWGKPVRPVGSTFGASFKVNDKWLYWEASVAEVEAFRIACEKLKLRPYYWSLDWILSKKRFDLLEAATGVNVAVPPVEPPVEPEYFTIGNCLWVNGRKEPTSAVDNRVVVVRAGQEVDNLKLENAGWNFVELGRIKCWIHGDYLI